MHNDASCKNFGIGTIKIKMFDGVVRALCDVWHVPKLKKNLIFLGTLESDGFSFKGMDGVLLIIEGAMVVMKEKR